MVTIYITFGQRYRDEEHPTFKKANPDGFLVVKGRSKRACITYAKVKLQNQYHNEHTSYEDGIGDWYTLGELDEWVVPDDWPHLSNEDVARVIGEYSE